MWWWRFFPSPRTSTQVSLLSPAHEPVPSAHSQYPIRNQLSTTMHIQNEWKLSYKRLQMSVPTLWHTRHKTQLYHCCKHADLDKQRPDKIPVKHVILTAVWLRIHIFRDVTILPDDWSPTFHRVMVPPSSRAVLPHTTILQNVSNHSLNYITSQPKDLCPKIYLHHWQPRTILIQVSPHLVLSKGKGHPITSHQGSRGGAEV
jgi:hypothetical protein